MSPHIIGASSVDLSQVAIEAVFPNEEFIQLEEIEVLLVYGKEACLDKRETLLCIVVQQLKGLCIPTIKAGYVFREE